VPPRRWLVRFRDAYVNAILRLVSSAAVGYGSAPYYAGAEPFVSSAAVVGWSFRVLIHRYRRFHAGQC
jgi:hypothetical protein